MLIVMLITALISSNGQSSMAAVALAGPVTNLVVCINGIGAGGTVIVAQCCGTGDRQRTARACAAAFHTSADLHAAKAAFLL